MSLRNRLVLPVIALVSLALLVACGNSPVRVVPPPGGGFTDSNLKGTYVFSIIGSDSLGNFLEITGTLVADGNGSLTGGTFDVNNPNGAGVGPITVTSGSTYHVTADGRGTATAKTSAGTWGFDFVLTSNQGGLITEFDSGGTGSGTLDLQSSVVQTDLAQPYALSLTGADSGVNTMSTVAGFTLSGAGTMSNGVQDINDSRTVLTSLSLSGTVLVGTGGAPGTAQLVTSTTLGTLAFDVFPIDANHLKFIETDSKAFLAGDAFPQTTIPASANTYVFNLSGLDFTGTTGPVPFVAGGFLVTDGGGGVSSTSAEDINDAGTVTTQIPFSGSYGTALTNGRTTLTLTAFNNRSLSNTTTFAAYPSAGGLQLLEIDTVNPGITSGVAYPQTPGATLASGQGYGLNLTGSNANGEEDDIAEFTNNSGTLTGVADFNDELGTGADNLNTQSVTATYSADSGNSGRGQIMSTAFNLISYAVNGSTTVFIEQDTSQVGVGSLGQQSATTKSNLAARQLVVLGLKAGGRVH